VSTGGQKAAAWFYFLPPGYRAKAYANLPAKNKEDYPDMQTALKEAFVWAETPEGDEFWNEVCRHYKVGMPLPPLTEDSTTPPPPTVGGTTKKKRISLKSAMKITSKLNVLCPITGEYRLPTFEEAFKNALTLCNVQIQ
jgi:hypothetical protein